MNTIKISLVNGLYKFAKISLLLSCLFFSLLLSQNAHAWKVKTHVWLSQQVVDEIRQNAIERADGTSFVSIYRPQIDTNNISIDPNPNAMLEDHEYGYTDQLGEKIGDYEVSPEIVSMLKDDKAMLSYFAGVMGPDNYPDLATGQTRVHPHTHVATDEWFKYLYSLLDEMDTLDFSGITDFNDGEDIARENQVNNLSRAANERAVRAFIYGYMTHGIGDLFMHTFVNNYAGGEFTIGVNMFKHNLIESYVAKKTPALDPLIVKLEVPEAVLNFIYHYLGDVRPGTELERLMPWTNPLEPLNAVLPDAEWNGLYEVSFPRIFSTFRNQLQRLKDNPAVLSNVYDTAYATAISEAQVCGGPLIPLCAPLYLKAEAIQAASITASLQHAVLLPFLAEWIADINIGLEEWVELNHELGRFIHLVESEEINKDNDKRYISDLIDTYTNLYFLPMLGIPDGVGITQQTISDIQGYFWPEWLKNKIFDFKANMKNNLFLAATSVLPRTGQAGGVVTTILPEEKMDFDLFMDYHFSPQTYFDEILRDRVMDDRYRKDDHKRNSKQLSLLELEQKLGLQKTYTEENGTFRSGYINPNWFRPAWNVRQLNKMLFLSQAELTRLTSDINCEGVCSSQPGATSRSTNPGTIPPNIMLGFLGSLDRDNQWKPFAEKYTDPFRDFSDDDFEGPRIFPDNQQSMNTSYSFKDKQVNGEVVEQSIDDFRPRREFGLDLTKTQMIFADCYAYLQLFKVQEGERYNKNCLPPQKTDTPVIQITGDAFTDVVNDLSAFEGIYSEPVQISILHDDPDALIFYTISEVNNPVQPVNNSDSNTPVENRSHPYTAPFTMTAPFNTGPRALVVRAQAYSPASQLSYPSEVQQASITIDAQLPNISFFPQTPNHTRSVNVSLFSSVGSTIFYTRNGQDPDFNSTRYNGNPISLGLGSHTIKAIAYRLGYNASAINIATYNVYSSSAIRVTAPIFTPPSNGNYVDSLLFGVESYTEGATLRYEITFFDDNNSPSIKEPDESSNIFTGPILLDKPGLYVVRVIGYKDGLPPSDLGAISYTIVESLGITDMPIIEPSETVYNNPVMVNLSADTIPPTGTGIQIFYTLDGTEPNVLPNESGNYNRPFELDGTTLIKVKARRSFFTTSKPAEQRFFFKAAPVAIDAASGRYENGLQVALSSGTVGAQIRYTTNGTIPDEASDLYQNPIDIAQSATLIARAFKQGYQASAATDASYEIFSPTAPVIGQQPQSITARENGNANFLVTATGVPDVQYQWQFNGSSIADATNPILEISKLKQLNAGLYRVEVSNSVDRVYSDEVELVVLEPETLPVFTQQPDSTFVEIGSSVELDVTVTGTPEPVIKWYKNGIDLQAQFGSKLRFSSVDVFHTGEYYAVATNVAGKVKGTAFQLIVTEPVVDVVAGPSPDANVKPSPDDGGSGGSLNPLSFLLLLLLSTLCRRQGNRSP